MIEDAVVARFEAAGWLVRKVIYAGIKGSPDRWAVRNGLWVIIEFKKFGERPDGMQARQIKHLRDHGQTVYVIDNIEAGYRLCSEMTELSNNRAA